MGRNQINWTRSAWVALGLVGMWGCDRPAAYVAPAPASLDLQPREVTLTTGRNLQFHWNLSDGSRPQTTWTVAPPEGGTVDATGFYVAPETPGVYTLRLEVPGETARSASAQITVVPVPNGTITPPRQVKPGSTGLQASVPAQERTTYAWEVEGGTVTDGADTPVMVFTAGEGPRIKLTCKVTNAARMTLRSTLEIATVSPVTLAITPESAILTTGRKMKFGYRLEGGTNDNVDWSVREPGGGTVDALGRYQAPSEPGQFTIQVVSQEDPARRAQARVQVVGAPRGEIRGPSSMVPGAMDQKAHVDPQPDTVYAWSITGGTLSSAPGGPAITFTAGPGPSLTLSCVITNAAGDAFTSTRTIPVSAE